MKKKFALALALALSLSLTACNKPAAEPAASNPDQSITEPTIEQTVHTEPTTETISTEALDSADAEIISDSTMLMQFELAFEQGKLAREVINNSDTLQFELELLAVTETDTVKLQEGYQNEYIEWRANKMKEEEASDLFTDTNETVYATSTVNIRSKPDTNSEKLGQLNWSDSVIRTGVGIDEVADWSEVQLSDGSTAYISNKYLSTTKPVQQQIQHKPSGGTSNTTGGNSGSTNNSESTGRVDPNSPMSSEYVPSADPNLNSGQTLEDTLNHLKNEGITIGGSGD